METMAQVMALFCFFFIINNNNYKEIVKMTDWKNYEWFLKKIKYISHHFAENYNMDNKN